MNDRTSSSKRSGRWRALALGLLLAATATARASIIDGTVVDQGTTELVFTAWDMNSGAPKVSFVKDLGISMNDFFVGAQQDSGSQYYWYLGAGAGSGGAGGTADTAWDTFLSTQVSAGTPVDPTKVRWAVVAYDTRGDLTPGTLNRYQTVEQGVSGDPTVINGLSDLTGDQLQNGEASWNTWLTFVNGRGTNPTQTNGSAVITITDPQAFICIVGNPCPSGGVLNFNIAPAGNAANVVGKSSWFYAVTSADQDFGDTPVAIDEFDNLGGDGYWGLAKIPGSSQYFLSYTLPAFASATEQAQHILFGNNFARLGGALSLSSPAGKAQSVLGLTESFLRGLAHQGQSASAGVDASSLSLGGRGQASIAAVPEPATLLLHGLGLVAVVAAARQRRTARR